MIDRSATRDGRAGAQFVLPALAFACLLFAVPFVWMVGLSLTNLNFSAANRSVGWVGTAHYRRALVSDPVFLQSLGRSATFTILCVLPELLIAIALAETIYRHEKIRRYLVPILALPALLPSVGVALYWRILLQGEFGILSFYLSKLGVPEARALLSDGSTVLVTLAVVDVWQWAPFATVLILAVRLSLPEQYVEAAILDGATAARAYRDVTLPLLMPAITVVALVRVIDAFKEFDKVYILTGGGPGSASELVSVYLWRIAFKYWDFGYAAAISIILYLALYGCTVASVRSTRAWSRS